MTREEIMALDADGIEERLSAIRGEMDTADDVAALSDEVDMLLEARKAIRDRVEARRKLSERIAGDQTLVGRKAPTQIEKEEKPMDINEIRSKGEYAAAWMRGVRSDDYSECRALLGANVSGGQVPVPEMLEREIKTAWEQHTLMSLVKHSYYKGNVKIGFELSATGAVVHVEGTAAPTEEVITIGTVELKAENIKKWITVSDEAIEGTTVDTVGYLYKEMAQKIVEKAEEVLIGKINAAPTASTATAPAVAELKVSALAIDTIVTAMALLSGMAKNIHLAMNRQTYAALKGVQLNAKYNADPFDGLRDRVVFTDKLPAFSAAGTGDTAIIIGDFGYGAQANFPNGNGITMKYDDLSLAEKDLVKIVGRQYVGMGVVAENAFVRITKQ